MEQSPYKSSFNQPKNPKIQPIIVRNHQLNRLSHKNLPKSIKSLTRNSTKIESFSSGSATPTLQNFKKFTKILQTQDVLLRADYDMNDKISFQNNFFSSKMKNLSSLSSFHLILWNNKSTRALFKNSASFKNLQTFKIHFNFYEFQGPNNLHILCKRLLYLRRLSSFSFHIFSSINFGPKHLETFSFFLQKLTQLRSLSLSFDKSNGDDNYWIENITPILPKLTSLTKIDINFEKTRMTHSKSLVDLFKAFSAIKNLTDIVLDLSFTSIPLEETAQEPLAEGLQCLDPSLIRKLKILPNENLTDEGLFQISWTLSKFTVLQILHFGLFRPNKITDTGIAEFSSTLCLLAALTSLSLSFSAPMQAQKAVQSVASALKFQKNLVYLKLSFHEDNTTDDQAQELSSSLRTLQSSLKFLEVSLSKQKSLTDSIVENLSEAIKELTLLKHLSLSFARGPKITNKGLEAVCLAIRDLSNLSFLALNFSENKEIKEIHELSLVLRRIPSLNSVDFRFMRCSQLSFGCLFTALREGHNVRRVSLSIPRNEQSVKEVESLSQRKSVLITWY